MDEHQLRAEVYSLVLHKVKAKRDAEMIRDAVGRMAKTYAAAQVASLMDKVTQLEADKDYLLNAPRLKWVGSGGIVQSQEVFDRLYTIVEKADGFDVHFGYMYRAFPKMKFPTMEAAKAACQADMNKWYAKQWEGSL